LPDVTMWEQVGKVTIGQVWCGQVWSRFGGGAVAKLRAPGQGFEAQTAPVTCYTSEDVTCSTNCRFLLHYGVI
jgi:hypothetical protein